MGKTNKLQLKKIQEKIRQRNSILGILIYRKISIVLAVLFSKLRITPNAVTLFSLIFTLIACGLFLSGEKIIILLGLIPLHIGRILDCVDGDLALITNNQTKLGAFIDPLADRVGDVLITFSLAYSYFKSTDNMLVIYLLIFWIIMLYFNSFFDNVAVQEKTSTGIENLRKSRGIFPERIKRYIRWDGAFSGSLISAMVLIWNIPLLIFIYIIVSLIPNIFTFRQILRTLKAGDLK